MADEVSVQLADKIVAAIDGEVWTPDIEIRRVWGPREKIENLVGKVWVPVVPCGKVEVSTDTNITDQEIIQVEIGIAKKVADREAATIDPLMTLYEDLDVFVRRRVYLINGQYAEWIGNDYLIEGCDAGELLKLRFVTCWRARFSLIRKHSTSITAPTS